MNGRHPLGAVAHLWRYPIKSLAPEPLQSAEIEGDGLVGDRRRALFVASEGHARTGRTYRGKEHNLMHTVATVEAARGLAAHRKLALSERDDGPFFDAEAISILFDRWLGDLEGKLGMTLDPQRYRPNLYVRAAAGFHFDEAALIGRALEVGSASLEVVAPIERCVTTTYDVETGEPEPLVHRVLAQRRENIMGVYCRTVRPGTVWIGDGVALRD